VSRDDLIRVYDDFTDGFSTVDLQMARQVLTALT
jgi:hypothetical protein